jgi:hypothetical protein
MDRHRRNKDPELADGGDDEYDGDDEGGCAHKPI